MPLGERSNLPRGVGLSEYDYSTPACVRKKTGTQTTVSFMRKGKLIRNPTMIFLISEYKVFSGHGPVKSWRGPVEIGRGSAQ